MHLFLNILKCILIELQRDKETEWGPGERDSFRKLIYSPDSISVQKSGACLRLQRGWQQITHLPHLSLLFPDLYQGAGLEVGWLGHELVLIRGAGVSSGHFG